MQENKVVAKYFGVVFAAALASGCSVSPKETGNAASGQADAALGASVYTINCSEVVQPEESVELDGIDGLMDDHQYYAALARIEAMSLDTQTHWLMWAQLLGHVGQLDYSEEVFGSIVNSCGSSRAYHGLGVVLVKQQKLQAAREMLESAKAMAPADASIRNDFGYALIKSGEYGRAAFELRTAYELAHGRGTATHNMVAAYYLNGGQAALDELRNDVQVSEKQLRAGVELAIRILGDAS